MIAWKDMDERERAVWSATVGATIAAKYAIYTIKDYRKLFEEAADLADLAVDEMRAYLKDWPPGLGEKP